MRPYTDEEIIRKASKVEKDPALIRDNKIDIAVDFGDGSDITHTYVVTFQKSTSEHSEWHFLEINELSSL